MKKYLSLLLVCLLLLSFSNVSAMDLRGKVGFSGIGGLGLPIGDFADEDKGGAKSGFGLGGNFEYFITDNVSIGGNFSYRKFGVKTEDVEEEFAAALQSELQQDLPGATVTADGDGDHKITSFGVFGKYLLTVSPRASPYLKFGVGMGSISPSVNISGSVFYEGERVGYETSVEGDFDSKAYVDIGCGFLYLISQSVALTGGVDLTHLMTDGAEGDIDSEFTLSYEGETMGATEKEKAEYDIDTNHISAFVGLTILVGGTR